MITTVEILFLGIRKDLKDPCQALQPLFFSDPVGSPLISEVWKLEAMTRLQMTGPILSLMGAHRGISATVAEIQTPSPSPQGGHVC